MPVRTARAPRKAEDVARRVEVFFRETLDVDLRIELRYAPTFQGAIFDGTNVVYGDGFASFEAIAHAVGHSIVTGDSAEERCEAATNLLQQSRIRIREFVPPAAGAEAPLLRVTRKPPRAAK